MSIEIDLPKFEACPLDCDRRRTLQDAAMKWRHPSALPIIEELVAKANMGESLACAARMMVDQATGLPHVQCPLDTPEQTVTLYSV